MQQKWIITDSFLSSDLISFQSCTQGSPFLFSRPGLQLFFWLPGGFLPTCTNTSTSCQYRTLRFQSIPWAFPRGFLLFQLFYSNKELSSSEQRAASMHVSLQSLWFPMDRRHTCWQPLTLSSTTMLCSSVGHGNPPLRFQSPSVVKASAVVPAQLPCSGWLCKG